MANEIQRFGAFTVIKRFDPHHVFSGYRNHDPHTIVIAKTCLHDSVDFRSELQASEALKCDPRSKDAHVVYMSDFEDIGGDHVACYFPYLDAVSLYSRFLHAERQTETQFQFSTWPLVTIAAFLLQVGEGIDVLHDAEVTHNDLNGENILVGNNHQDFTVIDLNRAKVGEKSSEFDYLDDNQRFASHTIRALLTGCPVVPKGNRAEWDYNPLPFHFLEDTYGPRVARAAEKIATNRTSSTLRLATHLLDELTSKRVDFSISTSLPRERRG